MAARTSLTLTKFLEDKESNKEAGVKYKVSNDRSKIRHEPKIIKAKALKLFKNLRVLSLSLCLEIL